MIGLKRCWFQNRPYFPHYDVTEAKRAQALTGGARNAAIHDIRRVMAANGGPLMKEPQHDQ